MAVFIALAALLLILGLALVLRPLLRARAGGGEPAREAANLQILRDQLRELDGDLEAGALTAEQHQRAREELERRAIEETRTAAVPEPARGGRSLVTAAALGVAIPLLAGLLYLQLGAPEALEVQPHVADAASSITREEFEEMTAKLSARLEQQPEDVVGWSMLGRAYRALERFEDSARAWRRAAELAPQDASVLADFAEALALSRQGSFAGEPSTLLARALRIDPDNAKALALAGGAAFERGDYARAIDRWQRLLALSKDDPEMVQALNAGIAEARSRLSGAPAPAAAVSGTVSLSPALAARASPEDSVFVFVRAAGDAGMPLAVTRVQVKNLPYDFRLDDSMAMVPEMKLSNFPELVVAARVSRSGGAQRAAGDLEGSSSVVSPGANGIRVVIDRTVQ